MFKTITIEKKGASTSEILAVAKQHYKPEHLSRIDFTWSTGKLVLTLKPKK